MQVSVYTFNFCQASVKDFELPCNNFVLSIRLLNKINLNLITNQIFFFSRTLNQIYVHVNSKRVLLYNVYGYVTQIDLNQTRLYGFSFTESTEKECVIYLSQSLI